MKGEGEHKLSREIASHPFFHGMTREFVHTVAAEAVERSFVADDMIAVEGTEADILYLVLEGKVALELGAADRPPITVQTVGSGEIVGWSWLVPPHRWRFSIRALKPTRLVAIDGGIMRRTLHAHPDWGFQFMVRFMPVLAERLENTRIQLLDIYGR
ncbi:MAG TPA: cyclic nucleotide-binding domain-containing protein [Thermoplasmata archaeon]|nr:cyclic nucleotide-binding domain-containing protein [Thermoplasmata archaeon]